MENGKDALKNPVALRVEWARHEDCPALSQIWQMCFGDSPDYVRFFFTRYLPRCRVMIAWANGTAAGSVYLLPAEIADGGRVRKAIYVYALGVLPAFRSRGIGGVMLRRVLSVAEAEDAVCFLRPASPELVSYYERLGMEKSHYAKMCQLSPDPAIRTEESTITEATPAEYTRQCRKMPLLSGTVFWDLPHIEFALSENRLTGGKCLRYEKDGRHAIVFMKREADGWCITESLPRADAAFLSGICAHFPGEAVHLRLPAKADDPDAFVLAMTYNIVYPSEEAPLGLLLD